MECTDTASVIVSIRPELSPVTNMRKLGFAWIISAGTLTMMGVSQSNSQSDPTITPLFFPNLTEPLYQLGRQLFLSKIIAGLDDN
jgi:hypothetical protein